MILPLLIMVGGFLGVDMSIMVEGISDFAVPGITRSGLMIRSKWDLGGGAPSVFAEVVASGFLYSFKIVSMGS